MAGEKDLSQQSIQTGFGVHPALYSMGNRDSFPLG